LKELNGEEWGNWWVECGWRGGIHKRKWRLRKSGVGDRGRWVTWGTHRSSRAWACHVVPRGPIIAPVRLSLCLPNQTRNLPIIIGYSFLSLPLTLLPRASPSLLLPFSYLFYANTHFLSYKIQFIFNINCYFYSYTTHQNQNQILHQPLLNNHIKYNNSLYWKLSYTTLLGVSIIHVVWTF